MTDGTAPHHFSRQHLQRSDWRIPILVVCLDVLHLRIILTNKVTVQRIPRALRQGVSLRRGDTHNVVDGRLRFLNRFSGLVNRDLVLLGRLRVPRQIQFLDGVDHFTMSAMTWQPASVTCEVNFLVY